MTTLTEFLLARVSEDEEAAKKAAHLKVAGPLIEWHPNSAFLVSNDALDRAERSHIARHDPARVLAECEAKRRIVEVCIETLAYESAGFPSTDGAVVDEAHSLAEVTLRALALPYRSHPDYREEWAV